MRDPRNDPLAADSADRGGGVADEASGPERRCILTGRHGSREEFVRLALSPDGQIVPDPLAKAPGRGAWIGVDKAGLAQAQAKGRLTSALARAFKGVRLAVPDDLADLVEAALTRALLQRLGLAMRAGQLVVGSDRIAGQARAGRIAALYHARDARTDGVAKLDQAWRVGQGAQGTALAGERLPLDRDALSVALGRENVVHLALADHAAAGRVASVLRRLVNFAETGPGPERASGGNDRIADGTAASREAAVNI